MMRKKPAAYVPTSKLTLLREASAADKEWMLEVAAVFGARDAGLVRLQNRGCGEPGSRLRALYDRYVATRDAYLSKCH